MKEALKENSGFESSAILRVQLGELPSIRNCRRISNDVSQLHQNYPVT